MLLPAGTKCTSGMVAEMAAGTRGAAGREGSACMLQGGNDGSASAWRSLCQVWCALLPVSKRPYRNFSVPKVALKSVAQCTRTQPAAASSQQRLENTRCAVSTCSAASV